jgi:hypothetical protein
MKTLIVPIFVFSLLATSSGSTLGQPTAIATFVLEKLMQKGVELALEKGYDLLQWSKARQAAKAEEAKAQWEVDKKIGVPTVLKNTLPEVEKALKATEGSGALIAVNISTNKDGIAPVLLSIQFLNVSSDPLTSLERATLSDSKNPLQKVNQPDSFTLDKRSYFLWITKKDGKLLLSNVIPRAKLMQSLSLVSSFTQLQKQEVSGKNSLQYLKSYETLAAEDQDKKRRAQTLEAIQAYKNAWNRSISAQSEAARSKEIAMSAAAMVTAMELTGMISIEQAKKAAISAGGISLPNDIKSRLEAASTEVELRNITDSWKGTTDTAHEKNSNYVKVTVTTQYQKGADLVVITDSLNFKSQSYKHDKLSDESKAKSSITGKALP